MNILLIDWNFVAAQGHAVRSVQPCAGVVSIHDLLHDAGDGKKAFVPDLIFQRERLGPRVFISHLEDMDCPKIFWSVDAHLNLFWHHHYARLFDAVLTPHAGFYDALPAEWQLPYVRTFAQPGLARKWREHDARSHDISFAGVVDRHRPVRQFMADYLLARHNTSVSRLPFQQMLALYDDTRLIPNESIYGEINFRLMEGASCGCCVLTPDIGSDLHANFEPGKEVLTYRHVQELDDLLRFLVKNRFIAEKIGRAARRRILARHLPKHRFSTLLETGQACCAHAQKGEDARRTLLFARIHWARSRLESCSLLPHLFPLLDALEPHPEVTAMRLRLLMETNQPRNAERLLLDILQAGADSSASSPGASFDYSLLCSAALLRLQDWKLFRLFWLLYQRKFPQMKKRMPESPFHACLLLADMLERTGRICMPGFLFDPRRHVPETAWDVLVMAEDLAVGDEAVRQWTQRIAALSKRTAFLHSQLGCCARISLNNPDDWRSRLEYAHACLRTYRLDEGLAEAALACEYATRSGQEAHFQRMAKGLGIRL